MRPVASAVVVAALAAAPLPACGPDEPAPSHADVVAVEAMGKAGGYRLRVTVRSPDAGCTRYADWWEVLSPDGALLYRRTLRHSHTHEQPFTRAGGPVPVEPDALLVIRAHMNDEGYGGQALRGRIAEGFAPWSAPEGFAADVEQRPPQPPHCAY